MKTSHVSMVHRNKDLIGLSIGSILLLLAPVVGMQLSDEVDWNGFDFAIIGFLLFISITTYGLVTRLAGNKNRWVIGLVIAAALALMWAELAVGIFGTPFAGS